MFLVTSFTVPNERLFFLKFNFFFERSMPDKYYEEKIHMHQCLVGLSQSSLGSRTQVQHCGWFLTNLMFEDDVSVCCGVAEQHSHQSFKIVAPKVRECPKLERGTSSNHPAFEDLDTGTLDRYQGCALDLNHTPAFLCGLTERELVKINFLTYTPKFRGPMFSFVRNVFTVILKIKVETHQMMNG